MTDNVTNITKSPPKILIVEDHEANIMVASLYMEQYGYEYDIARNGEDAVNKVKEGDYCTILMDVQMQGIDGLEATKQIREHEDRQSAKRTPIIGVTARAMKGDKERCIAVGMDDYIAKPFNPQELEQKLHLFTNIKRRAA